MRLARHSVCSGVSVPSSPFPPSEGVRFSRKIVPPSEGEFLRHARHSVCSGVSVPSSPFPPSEGVQYSCKIVSPSEGEFVRLARHSVCSDVSVPSSPFPPSEGALFSCEIVPFRALPATASVAAFPFHPALSHLRKVCSIPAKSSHLRKVS